MNFFVSFLKSRSISGHVVIATIITIAGAVMANQSLRDQILKLFIHHPSIGTGIVGICGIIVTLANFVKSQPSAQQQSPPAK